jgi:uncharacterized protein YdcH (DUF465 family)
MSGFVGYGLKASKTPIGKKVVETVKNIFTSKNKVSPDIKSVAPNVPTTKKQKLVSELKKTTQRLKSKVKNILTPNELAKGGRVGLKKGSKKKTNVEKIKKAFGSKKSLGMQSVIYGLDKNPDVTKADPKAKFIAAANKKKKTKKKVI